MKTHHSFIFFFLLLISKITLSQNPIPIAHWTFNHANANDESGSGINGTTTDITFSRGMDCDTGAYFNGITSGINFGNNLNDIFTDGTFSMCLWVKPYSYTSNDQYQDPSMIIQKWWSSEQASNTFILYLNSFCNHNKSISFTPLELNKWSHIAVISYQGNVKIYIDGKLEASDNGFTFNSTTYPLMLGTLHNNRYKFIGGMDDVRIYDEALTEDALDSIIAINKHSHQYLPRNIEVFGLIDKIIGVEAKSGYTYSWSNGSTESRINVSYETGVSEKTYTLTVTTDEGCSRTDTVTIKWINLSDFLAAHWSFNHANANDESGSGINGITTDVNFIRGMDCDTGAYFNGSTSGINFGDNLNNVFNDGTFTISLWVKPYSYSSKDQYKDLSMLIQKWATAGAPNNTFILYLNSFISSNNMLKFDPPELNIWSHIAVISNNGNINIYINGKLVANGSGFTFNTTNYPLMLGSLYNNRYKFYGGIDDVRIYDIALTKQILDSLISLNSMYKQYIPRNIDLFEKQDTIIGAEAKNGYNYFWNNSFTESKIKISYEPGISEKTMFFTVITDSNCIYEDTTTIKWMKTSEGLIAHWNFDDSVSLETSAIMSNVIVTEGVGCSNAFYFNGNKSYISLGDTLNNIISGNEFTISVWVYYNDTIKSDKVILSKWGDFLYDLNNSFILYINNFRFGQWVNYSYPTIRWQTPNTKKWHNYVIVKDGAIIKIYLNGKLVGQDSYLINTNSYPLSVGAYVRYDYSYSSSNMIGKIDDLRVYEKALSSNQINYLTKLSTVHKLGNIPREVEILKYTSLTIDAGEGYNSYLWWDGTTNREHDFFNVTQNMNNLFVKVKDDYLCYTDTFDIIIKIPESFEQNYSKNTLLYPNPVKDYLNINFKDQKPLGIEVLNLKGNIVRKVTPNNENFIRIDLHDLPKSIYFIKIKYLNETEIFKILIQ